MFLLGILATTLDQIREVLVLQLLFEMFLSIDVNVQEGFWLGG